MLMKIQNMCTHGSNPIKITYLGPICAYGNISLLIHYSYQRQSWVNTSFYLFILENHYNLEHTSCHCYNIRHDTIY